MTILATLAALLVVSSPPAHAETISFCDIDDNGSSDIVVGAPRENDGRVADAGAFHEFLATSTGLTPNSTWTARSPQVGGRIGESMMCTDFNADGFDDVVNGAPYWDIGRAENAGRVEILFGGPSGLQSGPVITQDSPGIRGRTQAGDLFGFDMTWCLFDGDRYPDLAVGVPGQDVRGVDGAGAVHIIYGGPNGLSRRDQVITQGANGIGDRAETGDNFGEYLTVGFVDGDSFCDLVVGVPSEDVRGKVNAGAVHVIYGTGDGLGRRDQLIHRDSPRINGRATAGERFGAPLFFGNLIRERGDADDQREEIIVGVPGQDIRGRRNAGAVHVLATSRSGVTGRGDFIVTQNSPGIAGRAQAEDQFGRSVVTGFFDDDAFLDLAVGAPGEAVGGRKNAGIVQIIFGDGRGLSRRSRTVTFEVTGFRPSRGDFFGATLAGGNFNADGFSDIAVGIPSLDWFRPSGRRVAIDGGGVVTILGGRAGLRGRGAQLLSQFDFTLDDGVSGAENCDFFGNFSPGLVLGFPDGVIARRCEGAGRDVPATGSASSTAAGSALQPSTAPELAPTDRPVPGRPG